MAALYEEEDTADTKPGRASSESNCSQHKWSESATKDIVLLNYPVGIFVFTMRIITSILPVISV